MKAWAWPVGIWSLWAIVPAILFASSPGAAAPLVQLHFGPTAMAYLGSAPSSLSVYAAMGQAIASVTLLALVRQRELSGNGAADRLWAALRLLGAWACLFALGELVVALAAVAAGAELRVTLSFAAYLGGLGFVASLPQLGWVLLARRLVRSFWLGVLVTLGGELLMSVGSSASQARGLQWPWPTLLRAELFSGRSDMLLTALAGTLAWASFGMLISLLPLPGATRNLVSSKHAAG